MVVPAQRFYVFKDYDVYSGPATNYPRTGKIKAGSTSYYIIETELGWVRIADQRGNHPIGWVKPA